MSDRKEVTDPRRTVTSTVAVAGGELSVGSVKTASDIPKNKIFASIEHLNGVHIAAPVYIGDVILENVADTGVDVIATRLVNKKEI